MANKVNSIDEIVDLIKDDGFEFKATKKNLKDVTESIFDAIGYFLSKGEDVRIHPIGILKVINKEARTARNPRTGETVQVPARKVIKFKSSVSMKEKLGG